MELRRNISAILLTAVLLPALVLAPLHRHQPVVDPPSAYGATGSAGTGNAESNTDVSPDADCCIDNCVGCESHIPHSHLEGVPHTDECLVCQFLTVVWIPAGEGAVGNPFVEYTCMEDAPAPHLTHFSLLGPSTRAPPVVFC